jgi:hypothetical protein
VVAYRKKRKNSYLRELYFMMDTRITLHVVYLSIDQQEEFEDTKGVFRRRKSNQVRQQMC